MRAKTVFVRSTARSCLCFFSFSFYHPEKIRCAGKTLFMRLTARSCRYYCSISCQPRNKVIKHCFTRHKDALFFINLFFLFWEKDPLNPTAEMIIYQLKFVSLKNSWYAYIVLSNQIIKGYPKLQKSLIFSVHVCISPQIYRSNFGLLGLDHFESWPDSNKWPTSFDRVPYYLKEKPLSNICI